MADWTYDLESDGDGCLLTETWTVRRGRILRWIGRLTTGVPDRVGFTAASIEQTLDRVKLRAERQD